jgi:CRISPR-associated protein Cmr5
MLRRIEHLLKPAMLAVETLREGNKIKKGYQGAISGFGASVMQMGLLPTLAVYSDQGSSADIKRDKLLAALHLIVKSEESKFSKKSTLIRATDFLKEVLALTDTEKEELQVNILQASIALKIAIRTFKLD